ncbi:hypothetical protein FB45DRAFT_1143942 [Roridomyces roridus]|uniref:Uncharacterized protein n=1 Tax=Roridomyces roridus TaxID=1738132 RepID=A0AAD7F9M1_9AGAR|nr:hypothetical protein FB45DRAFT_1143942 [Roridomyces roridus]
MKLEHKLTFPLERQSLVAWLISTVATVVITIYTSGLVFLTQTLSIRRSLGKAQMLTVTHHTVAAWWGIGSALASVFHSTPSISAVLPVFAYLAGILALHITSPALFVVQVFNSTVPVTVQTHGIPTFGFSGYQPSSPEARIDSWHSPLLYAEGALYYLPFVNSSSPTLGLERGMLYDVLDYSDSATGSATVDAVQFNMTCGYYADPVVNTTAYTITILGSDYGLSSPEIGIISTLSTPEQVFPGGSFSVFMGSALFYSTVPIVDSAGNTGPLMDIPWMAGAKVQSFRCSIGLVNQSITVDSQSRVLSSPAAAQKVSSLWSPFQDTGNKTASAGPYDTFANDVLHRTFQPQPHCARVTHMHHPASIQRCASRACSFDVLNSLEPNGPPPVDISLLQGNTVLFADNIDARLDANMSFIYKPTHIGQIIAGAVVSGALFLLSLQCSMFRRTTAGDEEIISGMDPLHIIWLYRNHPELEAELEQVVDPTASNLRKAGMVRTRLAGPRVTLGPCHWQSQTTARPS